MTILPTSFPILKDELVNIRNQGFVPCTRPNNKDGGIGNTLEDLLLVPENNLQEADYLDYEVKSQREATSSAITLFSMATEKRNNRRLFQEYSRIDKEDGVERLYWTIYMDRPAFLYDRYECQLEFDNLDSPQFLYVRVKDTKTGIEDKQAYWDLKKLRVKTAKKMKNLVICYAETMVKNYCRYFNYKNFECYFNFSFEKLLEYIRLGRVQIDFRIGADLEGKNAGKYHDHGTAFRIHGKDLLNLYNHVEKF